MIKCLAQVQTLLGGEFISMGILHETMFSPFRVAYSLVPEVTAPAACLIWSHTLQGPLTILNVLPMTIVGKD